MPFDGIVCKCITEELNELLCGARIEKVFQPEPDEIILNIRTRTRNQNLKLLLSASASFPRIHVTEGSRENPAAPPVFCMLLRKHLSGARITGVEFHDYERIITLLVESANEMGDLCVKKLIIEIMGRHSNIILTNEDNRILDAIKHVDNDISSVREVMPARLYTLPPIQDKTSLEQLDIPSFIHDLPSDSVTGVEKYLLDHIKGFSPLICKEICYCCDINGKAAISALTPAQKNNLEKHLLQLAGNITESRFKPVVLYKSEDRKTPADFYCLEITQYAGMAAASSMSQALDSFYDARDRSESLKQKNGDILKVLSNSLERCNKKIALQEEKLREVADREKLQLFGELLTANIYLLQDHVGKSVWLENYYSETNEKVEIQLDDSLTPQANAQLYFKRYAKAKSAFTNTSRQLEDSLNERIYLESVLQLLGNCKTVQEIEEVRQELMEQGYINSRRKQTGSKRPKESSPLQFRSSDGFDIQVGKNNRQNDTLTLKLASTTDIWLHTRNIPGSHVIIRRSGRDVPENTLLEAAILAAFHSRAGMSSNVPVDYTMVKHVHKPVGAKPGMVIYENFKTILVTPSEETIKRLSVEPSR